MSDTQQLRMLIDHRLNAAAEEIFGFVERTMTKYEDQVHLLNLEIDRQRKILAIALNPQIKLRRAEPEQFWTNVDQEDPQPPQIKEEPEVVWTGQEGSPLQGMDEGVEQRLQGLEEKIDTKDSLFPESSVAKALPVMDDTRDARFSQARMEDVVDQEKHSPFREQVAKALPVTDDTGDARFSQARVEDVVDQEKHSPFREQILSRACTDPITKADSSEDSDQDESPPVPKLRRTESVFMKGGIPEDSELFYSTSYSGEEFVPDSSEEGSSDCSRVIELPEQKRDSLEAQDFPPLPDSSTSLSLERGGHPPCTSLEKKNGTTNQSNEDMETENGYNFGSVIVSAVTKKGDGSRSYNKRHYCVFCFKPYGKIARHLEYVHANEREVARGCLFPRGSKQRKIHFDCLRNKGNFLHNASVMKSGRGTLVPKKQPLEQGKGQDFMHCVYCQGLFTRKVLWRHVRICKLKPTGEQTLPGKNRVQSLCAFTAPMPDNVSKDLWKLMNSMTQDDITFAAKHDSCIIQLGEYMLNKIGTNIKRHEHIRQKLRELGRLLISARKVTTLKTVQDFIDPKHYIEMIKAVKLTCGYASETNTYKTCGLARKLGHSLVKISKIVESHGRISGNTKSVEKAVDFQKVHSTRWNGLVSATVTRNIEGAKWNTPTVLPFTGDVQKLHVYLDQNLKECVRELSAQPTAQTWSHLAKVAMAEVILCNRRREGEVSCMPLSAFMSRVTSEPNEDIDWALSEAEKKLVRHFSRIETRGKKGRKVPVLLTPKMLAALELLVEKREECGVLKSNVYLFARPSATSHYRGSDCLRIYAKACGAKNPNALSSTKLRKRAGTRSTILNMNKTEMDQLANFLGHDIQIHRQFYRLPEGTLQLAKVSKVLLALEQGRLSEFKGMNLNEIEIDPDGLYGNLNGNLHIVKGIFQHFGK